MSHKLIMALLESEANRILSSVEGVEGVAITLVGPRSLPLGALVVAKDSNNPETIIKGIARLSDHIELLTRPLLPEEEDHAGDHSESVGGEGALQADADAGAPAADAAPRSESEPPPGETD